MPTPFVSKPVYGTSGIGVVVVEGFEPADDVLRLAGGRAVPVAEFVDKAAHFMDGGYLFQPRLAPHPALAQLGEGRVSTVRVMILRGGDGPEILHSVWRIPARGNVVDNSLRPGNLIAAVEPAEGRVVRVIDGFGPEEREIDDHPESGLPIKGLILPDWPALRRLGVGASELFPGLRLQAWDIALCPDGPVLLELNSKGGFSLPQRANARGILDARLRRFLDLGA